MAKKDYINKVNYWKKSEEYAKIKEELSAEDCEISTKSTDYKDSIFIKSKFYNIQKDIDLTETLQIVYIDNYINYISKSVSDGYINYKQDTITKDDLEIINKIVESIERTHEKTKKKRS